MKVVIAVLVVSLIGALVSFTYGEGEASRPPRVSAENWIPLSRDLGFVVTGDPGAKAPQAKVSQAKALLQLVPLQGYLVAQRSGVWRKLEYTLVPREDFRFIPLTEEP